MNTTITIQQQLQQQQLQTQPRKKYLFVLCPPYNGSTVLFQDKFRLEPYLKGKQTDLAPDMRATLVDWLVEVQENFELVHETLYMAVKLSDHYLTKAPTTRDKLLLVGAAAMFIACKFDVSQTYMKR